MCDCIMKMLPRHKHYNSKVHCLIWKQPMWITHPHAAFPCAPYGLLTRDSPCFLVHVPILPSGEMLGLDALESFQLQPPSKSLNSWHLDQQQVQIHLPTLWMLLTVLEWMPFYEHKPVHCATMNEKGLGCCNSLAWNYQCLSLDRTQACPFLFLFPPGKPLQPLSFPSSPLRIHLHYRPPCSLFDAALQCHA